MEKIIKKVVLVTGAAGSLGEHICEKLDKLGYQVWGTDKNKGKWVSEVDEIDLVTEPERFESMFFDYRPDVVIHCAATIYGVAGFNNNGYDILSDDLTMLKTVLETISKCKMDTKVVYTSSSMVYEKVNVEFGSAAHEDDIFLHPAPQTGYGLSKYVGEALLREWSEKTGNPYTIWRPFNIITPYEAPEGKKSGLGYSHVFADFFQNILIEKKNPFPIIGDGNQVRCFTWIGEVASVIAHNIENVKTNYEVFNIGNNEPVTMRALAQMIFEEAVRRGHLDKENTLEFYTAMNFDKDVKYRVPNVSKIAEVLGWKAEVKLKESISRLMDVWEKKL